MAPRIADKVARFPTGPGVYQWLESEELPELRTQLPGSADPERFSKLGDHLR